MGQKGLTERPGWFGRVLKIKEWMKKQGNGREFSLLASPCQPVRIKTEKKECED